MRTWTPVAARLARAAMAAVVVAVAAGACHRPPSCDPKTRVRLDATLKDSNGRSVNLASYRGRPLLINFWATWCGPCKEEIPVLMEVADLHESDVAVLGISVDDSEAALQTFAAANKVNYPLLVGLGHDDLLGAYDAQRAVPVSWFVASNGCPLAKHAGVATKEWFYQQLRQLS